MFNLLYFFEEIGTFTVMVFKLPKRIICKRKGHGWRFVGGGFMFTPKYSFICDRCGCRSDGTFDDLEKKGFNGTAKL